MVSREWTSCDETPSRTVSEPPVTAIRRWGLLDRHNSGRRLSSARCLNSRCLNSRRLHSARLHSARRGIDTEPANQVWLRFHRFGRIVNAIPGHRGTRGSAFGRPPAFDTVDGEGHSA